METSKTQSDGGSDLAPKQEHTGLVQKSKYDKMFGDEGFHMPIDASLPEIKIVRETAQFELPDGTCVKELTAQLLYWHNANQFWAVPFSERSNDDSPVPDCFSSDGMTPDGGDNTQAAACDVCPNNEWGSGENEGKKCRNTIRMYLLIAGNVIPSLLRAPPTSLAKKDKFMKWLTNMPNVCNAKGIGRAYQLLTVKFVLRKKEFASGMVASVLEPETVGMLEDDGYIQDLAALTREFKATYIKKIAEQMATEDDSSVAPDSETGNAMNEEFDRGENLAEQIRCELNEKRPDWLAEAIEQPDFPDSP